MPSNHHTLNLCKLTMENKHIKRPISIENLPRKYLDLVMVRIEEKKKGGNNPYFYINKPNNIYETKSCKNKLSLQRILNFGFATIPHSIIIVTNNPRVFEHLLRCNTARTITNACNGDYLVKLGNKNYLYQKLKPYNALKLIYEFLNSVVDPFKLEVIIRLQDSSGTTYLMTNKIEL